MKLIIQLLFYISIITVVLLTGFILLVSLMKDYKRAEKDTHSK